MLGNYKSYSVCYISNKGFAKCIDSVLSLYIRGKSYFIFFKSHPNYKDFISCDLSKISMKAISASDISSWIEFYGELMKEQDLIIKKKLMIELNALGYASDDDFEVFRILNGEGVEHRSNRKFKVVPEMIEEEEYDHEIYE